MYNGVLNVYKETGCTSHDVVNRLRRILGQKKIGHAGTLDPAAEGVLPVCLGAATKLCDYFTGSVKSYRVIMKLGIRTDTQDMTGTILTRQAAEVSEEDIRRCAEAFTGDIMQIPPMYSAVKMQGRKLYELARKGIDVERSPRPVRIEKIRIEAVDADEVQMLVTCSKGTYIRTLCADIGDKLGCGACVSKLVRTASGAFSAETALTLKEIEDFCAEGNIEEKILPIDSFFPDIASAGVGPALDLRLYNGNAFDANDLNLSGLPERLRLYDSKGVFIGLYEWDRRRKQYHPEKMFLPV